MRTAEVTRNTKETQIRVKLNLDGKGTAKLSTGLPTLTVVNHRSWLSS